MTYRHALLGVLGASLFFVSDVRAQHLHHVDAEPSSEADAPFIVPSRPLPAANARAANPKAGPLSNLEDTLRDLAVYAQSNARLAGDGMVAVDVIATGPEAMGRLEAGLVALGFETTGRGSAMLSGRLPVRALEAASALPGLRTAMTSHRLVHRRDATQAVAPFVSYRVGSVEGEASVALRADDARATYGVDGSGVCVGVLSDSFDGLGGAASGVASGDLPVVNVLDDGPGTDEGRAMIELAYDVAPGADFAFHTASDGFASFSGGILDLYNAGCSVIVDDISYAGEPFFQDGVIAQAVDYVVAQGASYFSSAGNSSNGSYEADFQDSGQLGFFEGPLHDFDPGPGVDVFQDILMFPGEILRFVFQYDEPSVLAGVESSEYPALYGGAAGQGPTSDYDLFLFNGPSLGAGLLDFSLNNNAADGVPFEFIQYQNNTGAIQTVYLAIEKFKGVGRRLKYINFGGDYLVIAEAEYGGASTTFGHSNAAGTFSTAAAPWFNTDQWNAFVAANPGTFGAGTAESFTAYGGLDIRLDPDGNRLGAPEARMKPDATASDGDNNTFFGFDVGVDADATPNFFGTSAAAPNAAAVAALMTEAAGGTLSPSDVYAALETTAADILPAPAFGISLGATPGFDVQTGFGLIRADAAVAEVAVLTSACSPEAPLSFSDFDADGNDPVYREFAAISNGGSADVDLSGCTFVAFNPRTEKVTYAATTTGTVAGGEEYVLATRNGDQTLPARKIPNGPGAIALVAAPVAVGASVADVLDDLVAAVVYVNENTIVGSVGGGTPSARAVSTGASFEAALAEARLVAADEDVDLSVTASPNPTSSALTVEFGAAGASEIRASIYDALGREVALVADGSFDAGRHEVTFDTSALPAGVYVVRVVVEGEARTTRITVVR